MFHELLNALEETLWVVFLSSILAFILGFFLSLLQFLPRQHSILTRTLLPFVNSCIHLICSIPYFIIMIIFFPIMLWLMREFHSQFSTIISLVLVSIPLFTKSCTSSFNRVPKELIEMAYGLGATPRHLIQKILIPESLNDIIFHFSQLLIQLIGLSVLLGLFANEGLGKLLLEKVYQDYQSSYLLGIIVCLAILVIAIQKLGQLLAYGSLKQLDKPQ